MLSLVLPVLASVLWGPLLLLGLISLGIYGVALGSISLFLAYRKKLNFFYLLASFIILHLSYGWGALVGICRLPFIK